MKLKDIEYINKNTGEMIEKEYLISLEQEDRKQYIRSLFSKYENRKEELSLQEITDLRKIIMKRKYKNKVYLRYDEGFYMVAMNMEDNFKKLSFEANGFLLLLSFNINKSGILIYKNNKPIKSFEKLRLFLNMSDRVWRRVKKEIDKFNIIRKETLKVGVVLILNPEYSGVSYEVTEYKFIVFSDYYKEKLSDIDYLYLVKKFEIDTSTI
ncbi:MAG: hypothetical protein DRG78_09050 [Epsilonproteobacteria bacterium]|nr:MAG: hypothetical protein DRG78_09050 [Campylobacterota bacterium]